MKRHAILLKSVLALAAVAVSCEQRAAAQSPPPPPASILPAATPPAATRATVPPPAPLPKSRLTLADLKAQFPQNREGHFQMEVPAILNTSTDREAQALLTGQPVETTGQVMPETIGNTDGKSLRITRTQLQCCSEHARQCSVALQFSGKAPAFKELAWVTVVGTLSYKQEDGKAVPIVTVREIKETTTPKNQLLQ
jgi:hypothetical protein